MVASVVLALRESPGWIPLMTVSAFLVMLGGIRVADRAYRKEIAARS